jgi:hypothetical protein
MHVNRQRMGGLNSRGLRKYQRRLGVRRKITNMLDIS